MRAVVLLPLYCWLQYDLHFQILCWQSSYSDRFVGAQSNLQNRLGHRQYTGDISAQASHVFQEDTIFPSILIESQLYFGAQTLTLAVRQGIHFPLESFCPFKGIEAIVLLSRPNSERCPLKDFTKYQFDHPVRRRIVQVSNEVITSSVTERAKTAEEQDANGDQAEIYLTKSELHMC